MDPKISVVVPVYKVEKFIAECLESILSQDFDAFEVIAVDDGSPDSSGTICDDFARRDPRLTVIHKENGGVAAARKTGVEHARGEWVTLVDADDLLLPHALSALYAASQQFPDADVIKGDSVVFVENDKLKKLTEAHRNAPAHEPVVVNSGLEYGKSVAVWKVFGGTVWGQLMRRQALLDTHAFDVPREMNYHDDITMCLRMSPKVRRAVWIFADVYGRRNNPNSISRTSSVRPLDYWLMAWNEVRRSFADCGEEWQIVWKTYIADAIAGRFLTSPGFSLHDPRVRAILAEIAPARKDMPPAQRKKLNLVLLLTRFPFSVLPESLIKLPLRNRDSLRRFFKKFL